MTSDEMSPPTQPHQTGEEWRPVVGYEGYYEVSDQGRVRSLHCGRYRHGYVLTLGRRNGYCFVALCRDGIGKKRPVHQLVLEAFVGPKPQGQQTRHLNSVRHDNRVENLAWGTHRENCDDRLRLPRRLTPRAELWNR